MNFCSKLENILAAQLLMSYRALTRGQMRRAGKDVLSISRGGSRFLCISLTHFQNPYPLCIPFFPFLFSFNQLHIELSERRNAGVKTTLTRCPPPSTPRPESLFADTSNYCWLLLMNGGWVQTLDK